MYMEESPSLYSLVLRILTNALAALCLFLFTCSHTLLAADQKPFLMVHTEYSPLNYTDERQQVVGINADIVREIFKRLDRPVVIQLYPWARALAMLEEGKADGGISAYYTEERAEYLDYSKEPITLQTVCLYTSTKHPIPYTGKLEEAYPHSLGYVRQYSYGQQLDSAIQYGRFSETTVINNLPAGLRMLTEKRLDLIVGYAMAVQQHIKSEGLSQEITELSPPVDRVPSFTIFSKKNQLLPLRELYDAKLKEIKADGTYDKILHSYLPEYNY